MVKFNYPKFIAGFVFRWRVFKELWYETRGFKRMLLIDHSLDEAMEKHRK